MRIVPLRTNTTVSEREYSHGSSHTIPVPTRTLLREMLLHDDGGAGKRLYPRDGSCDYVFRITYAPAMGGPAESVTDRPTSQFPKRTPERNMR
jgi:hypothetical protein